METSIIARFIEVFETLENQNKITNRTKEGEKYGYSSPGITAILKQRSKPSIEFLQAFCLDHNISLDWLFYGEGSMFNGKSYAESDSEPPKTQDEGAEYMRLKSRVEELEQELKQDRLTIRQLSTMLEKVTTEPQRRMA